MDNQALYAHVWPIRAVSRTKYTQTYNDSASTRADVILTNKAQAHHVRVFG